MHTHNLMKNNVGIWKNAGIEERIEAKKNLQTDCVNNAMAN